MTRSDSAGSTGAFRAARVDDERDAAEIRRRARRDGDAGRSAHRVGVGAPVGPAATRACPIVTLATAHPAKFPDAVERATGIRPGAARAPRRPVRAAGAHRAVANDLAAVEDLVRSVARR